MKKLISIILTMLIVFTILSSISVEAVNTDRNEYEITNTHNHADCISEHDDELCEVEMCDEPEEIILSVGSSIEVSATCSHSFKYANYSRIQHKKTCTKCGYSAIESHSNTYTILNNSQHKSICSKCSRVLTENHGGWTFISNSSSSHKRMCRCGYYTIESHTYQYSKNNNSTHKVTCSKCGRFIKYESHSVHYVDYIWGQWECPQCGYFSSGSLGFGYSLPPYLIGLSESRWCKLQTTYMQSIGKSLPPQQ